MSIKTDILWRIYLAFGLICLLGMAILFQAFKIQTVEGAHWRSMADSLTTAYIASEAERGNIYSEDGRLMATLLPFFEVRMDVNTKALTDNIFYNKVDSLALCLANHFQDATPQYYQKYLTNARRTGKRYLLIRKHATYPDLQAMKEWPLFRLGRYKGGFIAIQKNKRVNPFRMLAHRTIGYVRDDVQPVGLEGKFDSYLSGVAGKRLMQRIAGGVWIPINDDDEIESQNGQDIVTTINVDLQDVAEHALLKMLTKHDADHGCVIVMEVKTGKIKAIANLGKMKAGEYWEKYNYAVGESTEPGSTFKLASLLALLKDGLIHIEDSVDLEKGTKKYFDKEMQDSEEHEYRNVTIKHAFEISSNVGISKLIYEKYNDDPSKFIEHLKALHINEPTGIEIEGESTPYMSTPGVKGWSGVSLAWMSVGYGVQLTPLQTLNLYNAVANDGVMVKPYLVSEIQDHGETIEKFKPTVINKKIASDKVLDQVKVMLEGVVENGTAMGIKNDAYSIAGKTGTAKIADKKHGYKKTYQASFVGYFPADEPQYSCIVVVNSPTSGVYYGSSVAAPVFKEIADKLYATNVEMHTAMNDKDKFYYDNIPYAKTGHAQDIRQLYNAMGISNEMEGEQQWSYSTKKDHSIVLKERTIINELVPDVTGMGLKDALYLLENNGLRVKVSGRGRVTKQSLPVGKRIKAGEQIIIELS